MKTAGQAPTVKVDDHLLNPLFVPWREEVEIADLLSVARREEGFIPRLDFLGVQRDEALLVLSVEGLKEQGRKGFRLNHVLEDRPGADGRKLVMVSHEDQLCRRRKGIQEPVEEEEVDHGPLVNDQRVGLQRVHPVSVEDLLPRHILKETVEGLRFEARGLLNPLCRPPGGGRDGDPSAYPLKEGGDEDHEGRLPRSRSPCKNRGLTGEQGEDRRSLNIVQMDSLLLFELQNILFPHGGRKKEKPLQKLEPLGGSFLQGSHV
ncbi:MAG: hypothetical protein BWY86_01074 [Candidatus Aminicenantes bacterium ADurb.Bin508]|nr:MAG: hypothetical protein BWY86_01074 [Candidatus Aminicenantes bacterium ADurb.Bin508]